MPRPQNQKRQIRHARVRAKIFGTAERPRLVVFRSNRHTYAQLIDDEKGKTVVAAGDLVAKTKVTGESNRGKRPTDVGFNKVAVAYAIGERLAKDALAKKIKQAAFDRGGYIYTGRIKALAEGARAGGLKF